MAYGWSPEQMARVNERRAARGQKLLDPGKVDREYASKYEEEKDRRKKKLAKKPLEEEPEMSDFDKYLAYIRMRQALKGKKILPATMTGRAV
jgi:hypothetical protein